MHGRIALRCPDADALADLWRALDRIEAQTRRHWPYAGGAAAPLVDALLAARFAVRAMETEHDAACPYGCSLGAPPPQ